jgi:hypothetical protein
VPCNPPAAGGPPDGESWVQDCAAIDCANSKAMIQTSVRVMTGKKEASR